VTLSSPLGTPDDVDRKRRQARDAFLRVFPDGFDDELYLAWERDYKVAAAAQWRRAIGGKDALRTALAAGSHEAVAAAAVRIESGRPLLFSFEKMALRDAVLRSRDGARLFTEGLYDWLYGRGNEAARFDRWAATVAELPRRGTRVATWPVVTVFGPMARPRSHMFVKPLTTKRAAAAYGYDLAYSSKPGWTTYRGVLDFARTVRDDVADLGPRDLIDIQSFMWVIGSDEYADARAA
jgi:hypothetical protein